MLEAVAERNTPPFSSVRMRGLIEKGTGTWCDGAVRDVCAGGEYLYSISVNFPSGGTNDSDLSRFHRCNLGLVRLVLS